MQSISLYVEWINQIKASADEDWLTDVQRRAFEMLKNQWSNARFIGVHGSSGVGKTFIGWMLARYLGFVHCQAIDEVPAGSEQVVIDGQEYSRIMRLTATELRVGRVVVLSRRPPRDVMPTVEISLTERDVKQFQRNLIVNGVLQSFITDVTGTDLSEILRKEAIARGERQCH